MENITKFRLSEAPGNLGLQCDRTGLALAGVQLFRRSNGVFRPRPASEIRFGLLEVKTGLNPDFTENQNLVYPLAAITGHVTSFDRKIIQLGLVPGAPFPAFDVSEYYQRGPGYPGYIRPYPY